MQQSEPAPAGSDLVAVLDEARLRPFQMVVICVCFLIAACDGFDTQALAFVAPALRHDWQIPPAVFGPLFGAGLLGTMLGSILFGSLADRLGRKPLLLASTALFGVMSLLCAIADSVGILATYRFLAGLGLGGAIPNIIALVSEYAPRRIRSTAVVVAFAGFPAGAIAGGIVSASIIPRFGWQSVFIAGGLLPILLLPAILALVPESLRFLIATGREPQTVRRILGRISPQLAGVDWQRQRPGSGSGEHQPVRGLFREGRAHWTVLLWLLTFTTLLLAYFLVSWTPLLLAEAGVPHDRAIMGVVLLNLGGIIGGVTLGRISDRIGAFAVLVLAYGIGAAAVAAVGLMISSAPATILALIFVVGLSVFGAQMNITALAANHYPPSLRGTGVGWNMGIGRLGSFVGPTLAGGLVALGLVGGQLFLCAAIPALLAGLVVAVMSFRVPPRG